MKMDPIEGEEHETITDPITTAEVANPSIPTIKVQGYTRWNNEIIAIEQSPAEVPAQTAPTQPTLAAAIRSALVIQPKITISLSQEQISPKPSTSSSSTAQPSKPSAIPKRATRPNHFPPPSSSIASSAPTAVHVDVYNELFEDKPIRKVPPLQPAAAISAPRTVRSGAATSVPSGSQPPPPAAAANRPAGDHQPLLGARLATHSSAVASAVSKAKSVVSTANKYLDERYRCSMCNNPFSDPRVLDCLHTFCYVCLCNAAAAAGALELSASAAASAAATPTAAAGRGHAAGVSATSRWRLVMGGEKLTASASASSAVGAAVGGAGAEQHAMVAAGSGGGVSGGGGGVAAADGGSEMDYSVSGTVKSSDTAHFPKSYSNTSSLATQAGATLGGGGAKPKDRKHRLTNAAATAAGRRQSMAFPESSVKSIKCPLCETVTTAPVGGLNRLPCNYVVKRRVKEALMRLGRDLHTTVWCALCFNDTLAIACCLICNLNLCTFCKEAHIRQRSTSLHDVRYLNDLRANYQQQQEQDSAVAAGSGAGKRGAGKATKCSIHPTHDLKLFCVACYQVACSNCTILLHRGHRCEPIARAAKTYVKQVRTALDRTRPLTDYATETIAKLGAHSKRVTRHADAVEADVDRFLGEYAVALEVHQRTLHTQIGRAREAKMVRIREQQADLGQRCSAAREAIQFADDLLDVAGGSTDTEMLAFVGLLLRRFEHCQRSRAFLDPQLSDSLAFRAEIRAPTTAEQHNIPLYGIITTQTAVPRFCTVAAEGLMQLRVHRKVEVVMMSRDVEDKPLCHGGMQVDVVVKYRDATQRQLAATVSDRRDGTYVLAFVPDAAGAMMMSVMVAGKPVKGSPFGMCARTLRPHSGQFHCCTFCSSRASKTVVCACGSQMPGGYRGCGHGHEGHPGRRHWSCCASEAETSECSATNAFR